VRCGRCGNENAGTNRFCGMCGAPLVPKAQGGTPSAVQAGLPAQSIAASRAAAVPAQSPPMQPVGRAAPPASGGQAGSGSALVEPRPVTLSSFEVARDDEPDPEPIISGPSFLGLNKPAARRGGFRADRGREQLRSSGNVDYLLEEEEPRRGWGKLILVVVALALAGGFGYLRYKQGGFDWLKAVEKKPAATQAAGAGQNGTDSGGQAGTAAAPESASLPGGGAVTAPAAGGTTQGGTTASGAAPTPATSQPASSTVASPTASTPPTPVQSDSSSQSNSPVQSKPGDTSAATEAAPAAANSGSDSDSSDEAQPTVTKAAPPKPAATRPTVAKPSPAKPVDTVAEAQRYVYGNGVQQDCDRGLRMLKTAAGQSDAKAMISLGALYSTGTCAPRDLPTAYRWFALALHKQPDNLPLQGDLQKLWSQMTPPERQLAIKLSQ
jgi:hypothetical protein